MTLSARLSADNSDLAAEALAHPFVCRLSDGSLAREIFASYVAQDAFFLLLYLGKRGRPKVRIHGRPRSDRKKRFLLSAVAPSTSTRHPRKAKPINWAQRGGLASGREMSADAEATFHRASCTLGNQVIGASDGPPFRQESRPTRVCRTPGAGSGLLAEASTLRAGTANIPPCRTLGRRTGLGAAVVLPVAGTDRLIEHSTTRGERVMRCPRAERGPSPDLDRGSEHVSSDRSILEGCRGFIGCKSPAIAEKYRQVLPGRKWRTS